MEKRGFEENVTVDEGRDPGTGVRTQLHFEGDELIVQKDFDAEPHLEHAKHARDSTAGQRWGNGRFVGHIPPLYYGPISMIRDPAEREAAITKFFREQSAFIMFDRFKP